MTGSDTGAPSGAAAPQGRRDEAAATSPTAAQAASPTSTTEGGALPKQLFLKAVREVADVAAETDKAVERIARHRHTVANTAAAVAGR